MTKDEKLYTEMRKNPLEYLSKYICPYLVGNEWDAIRKCTLLMLVTHKDTLTRTRLHMLLVGLPGTGKTEFMLWMQENIGGVFINADLTSKVGLVGDARGLKIKPGLLADCHGHLILCDELDKMSNGDQSGLLQALEEGKYSIIKGSQRERFDAEVRVIAGANEISKIQKPLIDRFDFVFNVSMSSRKERAGNVDSIIDSFLVGQNQDNINVLNGYLDWIEKRKIDVLPQDSADIKYMISEYILRTATNINVVSYRSLELSIMRIAYAMAKLQGTYIQRAHISNAIYVKDIMIKNMVDQRFV